MNANRTAEVAARCRSLNRQMVDAADAGDWPGVRDLLAKRNALLRAAVLTDGRLIEEIIRQDKALLDRSIARRRAVLGELKRFGKAREAVSAYRNAGG